VWPFTSVSLVDRESSQLILALQDDGDLARRRFHGDAIHLNLGIADRQVEALGMRKDFPMARDRHSPVPFVHWRERRQQARVSSLGAFHVEVPDLFKAQPEFVSQLQPTQTVSRLWLMNS
jgi:hypothetical protein